MKIRIATIADVVKMAEVRVRTWQSAYRGIIPQEFLDHLDSAEIAQRWRASMFENRPEDTIAVVAEDERGEVFGFASAGPIRDDIPEYESEIYTLYVLAQYQRQGAGRALMQAACRELLTQGRIRLLVWVLTLNPACKFYTALGGVPVHTKNAVIGGLTLEETGFGWLDLRSLLR